MAEIDKDKLASIVGFHEDGEHMKKEVKIIKDKKQFSIRIPLKFAEMAQISEKEDTFLFHLVPKEIDGKHIFTIEAELKHGKERI